MHSYILAARQREIYKNMFIVHTVMIYFLQASTGFHEQGLEMSEKAANVQRELLLKITLKCHKKVGLFGRKMRSGLRLLSNRSNALTAGSQLRP